MNHPVSSDIFPLPLTAFERYMLRDDRPDYPMVVPCLIEFEGRVDRDAMDAALRESLQLHPLFCSVVRKKGGRLVWETVERDPPTIAWDDYDAPIDYASNPRIDLSRECGLRVWARSDEHRFRILFLFHHACCDGMGAMQFTEDLLAAYGNRVEGGTAYPISRQEDIPLLTERGKFDFQPPEPISTWEIVRGTIVETFRLFTRQAVLLASGGSVGSNGAPATPVTALRTLSPNQTDRLIRYAKGREATLNDLLLREMYIVVRQWNEEHGGIRPGQWIKINVPTNLRTGKTAASPACNIIGYAFLCRSMRDCEDGDTLLETIRREMRFIRDWNLGAMFIDGLQFCAKIPGLLRLTTSKHLSYATVVLSNMGILNKGFRCEKHRNADRIRVGDLELTSLTAFPPVRPKTRAALVAGTYDGRMQFSLGMDSRFFTAAEAESFMDCYCRQLEETIAEIADAEMVAKPA